MTSGTFPDRGVDVEVLDAAEFTKQGDAMNFKKAAPIYLMADWEGVTSMYCVRTWSHLRYPCPPCSRNVGSMYKFRHRANPNAMTGHNNTS